MGDNGLVCLFVRKLNYLRFYMYKFVWFFVLFLRNCIYIRKDLILIILIYEIKIVMFSII